MTDWQPIETAPKDGTKVDLWVTGMQGDHRVVDAYWYQKYEDWWVDRAPLGYEDPFILKATHWMPIPAPPDNRAQEKRTA